MTKERKPLKTRIGGLTNDMSGVRVRINKNKKTSIKSIVYSDPRYMSLARKDIDLAFDGLRGLNRFQFHPNEKLEEKFTYAQYVCKYTRYCHLTTWKFEISIDRAEEYVLEELKKAEEIIDGLITCNQWGKNDLRLLKKIHENVKARIYNIQERYCKGLNTLFDFNEIWPGNCMKKLQSKKVNLKT